MSKIVWLILCFGLGGIGVFAFLFIEGKSQHEDSFDTEYFYLANEITYENDQLILNKFNWGATLSRRGGGTKYQKSDTIPKELEEIRVDIINCGGYLASGKAIYLGEFEWKVELIPDSVASDMGEKMKKCGSQVGSVDDYVIAVIPKNSRQKSWKTEISGSEAYHLLPYNLQEEADCITDEKGVLSTGQGDDWLDTDGDGKIDFIRLSVSCQSRCSDAYTCTATYKLIKGEWVKMSFSRPA
jgi:hypothetical protein